MPEVKKPVIVVVPVYRHALTLDEETSLRHLDHYLPDVPKVLIMPAGLKYRRPGYSVQEFPPAYFTDTRAYCRLCQSRAFYDRFDAFEWMLIYQCDALLLSGDIDRFLALPVDYIGAPLLIPDLIGGPRYGGVGNGGFCLRRISAFQRVLAITGDIPNVKYPADLLEDCWFSQHVPDIDPTFRFADFQTALAFSWELFPRGLAQIANGVLPLGVHAWAKYDRAFWAPYLLGPDGKERPRQKPEPLVPDSPAAQDLATLRMTITDTRIVWGGQPHYQKPDPQWIMLTDPAGYLHISAPEPAAMHLTQFLIFEICEACNLGAVHTWCPNRSPDRFANSTGRRPLSDDQIAALAHEAYTQHGFTGQVGWHYYNEPLLALPRLKALMARIKAETPAARFVLWSNGTKVPKDAAELGQFEIANFTNYDNTDHSRVAAHVQHLHIREPQPDQRLNPPSSDSKAPCMRMFVELVFDYYGEVHICCQDWRGAVKIGNAHDDALPAILKRWNAVRATMIGKEMLATAPLTCRQCSLRCLKIPAMVPEIAERARIARAYIRVPREKGGTAAVNPMQASMPAPAPLGKAAYLMAVAYRIPAKNVRSFFQWNDARFRAAELRVVLVVEDDYKGLPEYVMQLKFTRPMPVYAAAWTRNAGVAVCLACGGDPILTADIDIEIPAAALIAMLNVGENECAVPCYRMAEKWETRHTVFIPAPYATGAVSMRAANWRRLHYDERCVGYGVEDGIFQQDVRLAGLKVIARDQPVYHNAHDQGTCQAEFHGRTDQWHRDDGFCPENFHENERFKRY